MLENDDEIKSLREENKKLREWILNCPLFDKEDVILSSVKPHGGGARIPVPKKYIGKQVKVEVLREFND